MRISPFFQQLVDTLEEKNKLQLAIEKLVDAGFNSKNNFIPVFDDQSLTEVLVEEGVVQTHNAKAYIIQDTLLLAHVGFQKLKSIFHVETLNTIEAVDDFLEKVDHFREGSPFRLGRNAITKMIRPYLLLYLNHHSNYNFDDVLRIDNETDFNRAYWSRIYPMLKVLPDLYLNHERLFALMDKQAEFGKDMYDWYPALGRIIATDLSAAWSMLEIAKNRERKDYLLLANVLNFLSKKDFTSAFQQLKHFYSDPDFKVAALFGFSFVEYPSIKYVQEVLQLLESGCTLPPDFPLPNPSGTTCISILNSPICTKSQKKQATELFQQMISTANIPGKVYLLLDLGRLKDQENLICYILKEFYLNEKLQHSGCWKHVDHILAKFKDKLLVFEIIEAFFQAVPKEDCGKVFEYAISKIPNALICSKITTWFNDDRPLFNYKSAELIRQLKIRNFYLTLDTTLLNKLSFQDIQFITFKILGYVVSSENLSSLVFSLIKREPVDARIEELVEFAFREYILLNYRSTAEFLKKKKTSSNSIEKKLAKKILTEYELVKANRLALLHLKELQPPRSRIEEYLKRQSKKYNIEKTIDESSLFLQHAQQIKLRAGLGFFSGQPDNFPEIAPLRKISTQIELPAGEFIDSTGQAVFRAFCQSFKRQT